MAYRILLTSLLLSLLLLISCNDQIVNEISVDIDPTPKEVKYTEAGWAKFEAGDYSAAKDSFLAAIRVNSLYADAFNGLGWSYGHLDSLELASGYFSVAKLMDQNSIIFRDASAGRAFINLRQESYYAAINDANSGLRWDSYRGAYSKYVFRHDLDVTDQDLFLVKAESYFFLEDYRLCYYSLLSIDYELDISESDPEGLALAIEQLRGNI
jgi:tetratricopeptide (TPR) repeat protein